MSLYNISLQMVYNKSLLGLTSRCYGMIKLGKFMRKVDALASKTPIVKINPWRLGHVPSIFLFLGSHILFCSWCSLSLLLSSSPTVNCVKSLTVLVLLSLFLQFCISFHNSLINQAYHQNLNTYTPRTST